MDLQRMKEITPRMEKQSNEEGLITFTQLHEASSLVIAVLADYYQERIKESSLDDVKDFINKVLRVCMTTVD